MVEMENMKQMIQELLGGMEERINADRKADWDELKAKMDSNQEKAAKHEKLLLTNQAAQSRMEAKMVSNQEKAEARMVKYEETMDDYCNKRMAMLDAHHKNIMASLGQTEANTEKTVLDSEMMQPVEEHQGIPKGVVAVMPVRGLRERRRVQKLATERRQKPTC
jgi:hypothetical protein